MTLPRFQDIKIGSITAPAPGHPVFILRGVGPADPWYVVKKENFRASYGNYYGRDPWKDNNQQAQKAVLKSRDEFKKSFEFMAQTYKACTNHLPEFRVIDVFEMASVFSTLQQFNFNHALFDDNFIADQKKNDEVVTTMWTLIDCLHGLFDWKGLAKKDLPEGNAKARAVIKFLSHNDDLARELGRIVAVDCFFGQNDRTAWNYNHETKKWTWRALNLGNYFLMETGLHGNCVFTGLDFFDPNTTMLNLFGDFAQQDNNELLPWPGRFFLNLSEGGVKPQTDSLLDSLNDSFAENHLPAVFGIGHKIACAKGFKEGAAALKKYLNKETGKPPGVKARKAKLGW